MIQNNIGSQSSAESQKLETPSLVETRQGVSVLYKDKYLYSKYDPSKSILNIISNLTIPERSIITVFSPVLWLGLKELILKLPSSSCIAAFEYEKPLYDFALQNFPEELKNLLNERIYFFNNSNISDYYSFIQHNHFRKTLKIDFSAGSAFYKTEYDEISLLTQRVIDQFWKNRLTLIKFGRLFSKNIFKNLSLLPSSIPLTSLYASVDKPIIVLGAGESLDETITVLKNKRESFFIISVDAAAASLLDSGIKPDAIVAVEAQQVIEKAYIGRPSDSGVLLIMDLVSRNHIAKIVNGPVSFYVSEYSKLEFLDRLSKAELLPPVIKPLGSVGLVAMEIALRLRKDESTAIYFSGLDFSYTPGVTHARGTPSHKNRLSTNNRLNQLPNIDSAFAEGTFWINSKDSKKMISSKALESYALLFKETFEDCKNIFDCGKSGIELEFIKSDLNNEPASRPLTECKNYEFTEKNLYDNKNTVMTFLENEETVLKTLKDLFINGDESYFRKPEISLSEQINDLLKAREYLYLHFPDDLQNTNLQSFYNRIRIELDFFLKEIATSKSLLSEN